MTLIQDLGTKTTISANGKRDTRKWGIFECPSCNKHLELKMFKGLKNNTCGKAGCRLRPSGIVLMDNEDKVNNLPHHAAFRDFYGRIKDSVHSEWNTLSKFRNDMYSSYVALKVNEAKRVTAFVSSSEKYNKRNFTWTYEEYIAPTDFIADVEVGTKHSLLLAKELNVPHGNIIRTLRKMPDDFGVTTYDTLAVPGFINRPYKAYTLTTTQWVRLRDRVLDSQKKISNNVYVVQGNGLTKIGIATNVNVRLSALQTSSPIKLTLVMHAGVQDARAVEKALHKKYAAENTHGEWFNLSPEQLQEVIDYLDKQ